MVLQKLFGVSNLTISSWLGLATLGYAHSLPAPAGTRLVTVTWGLGTRLTDKLFFFRERPECDPSERDTSVPVVGNPVLRVKLSNGSDKTPAKCMSTLAQDNLTCLCTQWAMTMSSNYSYSCTVSHNDVMQIYPSVTGNQFSFTSITAVCKTHLESCQLYSALPSTTLCLTSVNPNMNTGYH